MIPLTFPTLLFYRKQEEKRKERKKKRSAFMGNHRIQVPYVSRLALSNASGYRKRKGKRKKGSIGRLLVRRKKAMPPPASHMPLTVL